MIGLPSFLKRKPQAARPPAATAATETPPAPKPGKPLHFPGAAGEKTRDLLVGHDGERVGFRKPIEG
jgi:hypothetical protein